MGRREIRAAGRREGGKRRIANGEWRIGMSFGRATDQVLSGSAGMAGSHDAGRGLLSADQRLSSGRNVRPDLTDTTCGGLNSRKYCRRPWARAQRLVRAVPADFPRLFERTRNALVIGGEGGTGLRRWDTAAHRAMPDIGPETPDAYKSAATEGHNEVKSLFSSIRHSPFAIRARTLHVRA